MDSDFRKMGKFHQSHICYGCWVTTVLLALLALFPFPPRAAHGSAGITVQLTNMFFSLLPFLFRYPFGMNLILGLERLAQ